MLPFAPKHIVPSSNLVYHERIVAFIYPTCSSIESSYLRSNFAIRHLADGAVRVTVR
jgi:hypothetical protein